MLTPDATAGRFNDPPTGFPEGVQRHPKHGSTKRVVQSILELTIACQQVLMLWLHKPHEQTLPFSVLVALNDAGDGVVYRFPFIPVAEFGG